MHNYITCDEHSIVRAPQYVNLFERLWGHLEGPISKQLPSVLKNIKKLWRGKYQQAIRVLDA